MSIRFKISSRLQLKGLNYSEKGQSNWRPSTERGQYLYKTYDLGLFQNLAPETFRESLGILDLLDSIPAFSLPSFVSALDIGAKNWRYLPALIAFLRVKEKCSSIKLLGVELDAYRIYANLRTRFSYAEYFTKVCRNDVVEPKYLAADIRDVNVLGDVIFWFFPFVSIAPHLSWGLPLSLFDHRAVAAHVENLLKTRGVLVIANQGEWEWELVQKNFSKLSLIFQKTLEGSLHQSVYPIFLSVWRREP